MPRLYSDKTETLTVLEYNEDENYHLCKDENGHLRRFDFYTNGDIDDWVEEELVGRQIKIKSSHAYLEIAHGVSICKGPDEGDDK